jgi:hypothetical protein
VTPAAGRRIARQAWSRGETRCDHRLDAATRWCIR